MKLIEKYLVACINLYGYITKDKLIEIYNVQNDKQISEIEKVSNTVLDKNYIHKINNNFVHEALFVNEIIEEHLSRIEGIPYYIPNKEELLKYVDEYYFEETTYYFDLLKHLKENYKLVTRDVTGIASEIREMCTHVFDIEFILEEVEPLGIKPKTKKALIDLTKYISILFENTRMWENNGFTPHEIEEQGFHETLSKEEVLQEFYKFLKENSKEFIKKIPENRPFNIIYKTQFNTKYNESLQNEVNGLLYLITELVDDYLIYIYNLLEIYPLSYTSLVEMMIVYFEGDDYIDVLKCLINAFEISNKKNLSNPVKDFFKEQDNSFYITALNNLGFEYKYMSEFEKSIKVYQKALKYDKFDYLDIKESLLINYQMTGKFDKYAKTFNKIDENSIYKKYIRLLEKCVNAKSIIDEYHRAVERSELVMESLCTDYDLSDQINDDEYKFLQDYYYIFKDNEDVMTKLLETYNSYNSKE